METAVADTGFVVALLNQADDYHHAVTAVYLQQQDVLLPQTVLAEVAYLLAREAGNRTVVAFLRGLAASRFKLTALQEQDIARTAEILARYADSRIDFVDATVMAIAERYQLTKVLTLDQRDFRMFRTVRLRHHCSLAVALLSIPIAEARGLSEIF